MGLTTQRARINSQQWTWSINLAQKLHTMGKKKLHERELILGRFSWHKWLILIMLECFKDRQRDKNFSFHFTLPAAANSASEVQLWGQSFYSSDKFGTSPPVLPWRSNSQRFYRTLRTVSGKPVKAGQKTFSYDRETSFMNHSRLP